MDEYEISDGGTCSLIRHNFSLVTRFSPCTGSREIFGVKCKCGYIDKQFDVLQKNKHEHFHKAQRAWEKMRRLVAIQAQAISPDGSVMPEEKMQKFANATVAVKKYIDYNLERCAAIDDFIANEMTESIGE